MSQNQNLRTTITASIISSLLTGLLMLLASGARINLQTNVQDSQALLEKVQKSQQDYKRLNDELYKVKQESKTDAELPR
jgi:Na+-translocating ferredoxin:NAD+ oxidoreductase RnfG subunit